MNTYATLPARLVADAAQRALMALPDTDPLTEEGADLRDEIWKIECIRHLALASVEHGIGPIIHITARDFQLIAAYWSVDLQC